LFRFALISNPDSRGMTGNADQATRLMAVVA
jgi:hypothetical protein